eukprot:g42337.t1
MTKTVSAWTTRTGSFPSHSEFLSSPGATSLTLGRGNIFSMSIVSRLLSILCILPKVWCPELATITLFVFSEKIHISTPNKYEYQYIQKPAKMVHFDVAVKAHNDAHFALSTGPRDTAEMIEIVIGGRQNMRTWIAVSKMGEPVVSANTPHILSWDEFRNFWVSWKTGIVQVGHGVTPSNQSLIVEWAVTRLLEINYIGFSTGWGSVGEFKIWRKEESDENHNEAFTLGVPHNVVPGSERATASMI